MRIARSIPDQDRWWLLTPAFSIGLLLWIVLVFEPLIIGVRPKATGNGHELHHAGYRIAVSIRDQEIVVVHPDGSTEALENLELATILRRRFKEYAVQGLYYAEVFDLVVDVSGESSHETLLKIYKIAANAGFRRIGITVGPANVSL